MTSLHGNTEIFDFKHKYYFQRNYNFLPEIKEYTKGSLMWGIDRLPVLGDFCQLVKLSELDDLLDSPQAEMTIFAFKGNDIIDFSKMDKLEARKIVMFSMIPKSIYLSTLENFRMIYIDTKLPSAKLLIEHRGDSFMVNIYAKIVDCQKFFNGHMYILDKAIFPDDEVNGMSY